MFRMYASNSHSYTYLILALGIVREPTRWGFIISKYPGTHDIGLPTIRILSYPDKNGMILPTIHILSVTCNL